MAYPKILAEVQEFEVEGQKSVKIDKENRVIEVVLGETVDISSVTLRVLKFTEEATCNDLQIGMTLDLSIPVFFKIKTYQEYDWKIIATQPIERYVKCAGQVGEPLFDLNARLVTVPVSDKMSFGEITFTGMKLEPEGSVIKSYEEKDESGEVKYIPLPEFPFSLNCNLWRYFIVEYKGQEYRWGINVVKKSVSLSVSGVNAWARKADVSGMFEDSEGLTLNYRVKGEETWTDFSDIKVSGTSFIATIAGLQPATEYEVKAVCGDKSTEVFSFITEEEQTLPNMGFDSWWQSGKIWYPNADGTDKVWDSANPGSGNFGFIPTVPVADVAAQGQGKQAAKLESLYAVIAFAAGNIYTGSFVKIDGVGAILDWGTPFSSRPLAMKGYYKYLPQKINKADKNHNSLIGTGDICQIMVFLTDWDKPFRINTRKGEFVDIENDSHIIAFGKMESGEAFSSYKEFKIDLEYRDLNRKPKYIVVVATSSKYGDFFTGGVGSTLWVDEFEFIYDPNQL